MVIYRQLVAAGTTVQEDILTAVLFDSLPSDMETVRQHLSSIDCNTVDDVFQAMKNYYDSRTSKIVSSNNNNKSNTLQSAATEKALSFDEAVSKGVCFQFHQHGKCQNGNKCSFKHISNSNNNKSNIKSNQSNKNKKKNKDKRSSSSSSSASSSDDSEISVPFTDVDYIDYDTMTHIPMEIESANTIQSDSNFLQINNKYKSILDTGASKHATPLSETDSLLTDVEEVNPIPMLGISNKVMFIKKICNMKITPRVKLTNVLIVPNASTNLISASRLIDAGLKITLEKSKATVNTQSGTLLMTFKRVGGVWVLDLPTPLADLDEDGNGYLLRPVTTAPKNTIPKKGQQTRGQL